MDAGVHAAYGLEGAGVSGEVKVHKRTVQGIRQGELKLEEQEL